MIKFIAFRCVSLAAVKRRQDNRPIKRRPSAFNQESRRRDAAPKTALVLKTRRETPQSTPINWLNLMAAKIQSPSSFHSNRVVIGGDLTTDKKQRRASFQKTPPKKGPKRNWQRQIKLNLERNKIWKKKRKRKKKKDRRLEFEIESFQTKCTIKGPTESFAFDLQRSSSPPIISTRPLYWSQFN